MCVMIETGRDVIYFHFKKYIEYKHHVAPPPLLLFINSTRDPLTIHYENTRVHTIQITGKTKRT